MYTVRVFVGNKTSEDSPYKGRQIYGDGGSMMFEYRPVVSDIILDGYRKAYEIERIICVTPTVLHAYCIELQPNESDPSNFGVSGIPETLIPHAYEQIKAFQHYYKDLPSHFDIE